MKQELDTIRTLGRLLDDLERVRIMNSNRIAALEREYGSALPHLSEIGRQVSAIEHEAELELKRAWRKHPLAPWAKEIKGCGEKLIARLIAEIGDPAERPNVAKLWAFCGHGDPERSQKRKGMTQEELFKQGSPIAKKRVYLLAAQFRRTPGSYYREVYDEARKKYANRVHAKSCVRCGPAGKPAPVGSEWSLGHQDAAALRYVGKEFLKDLWVASRAKGVSISNCSTPASRSPYSMVESRAIDRSIPTPRPPAKVAPISTSSSRANALPIPTDEPPAELRRS